MEERNPQRVGVIDLGSNTARLIVMSAIAGFAYRLEDEIREVVRLRHGMTAEGLNEDAVQRALVTLRLFKRFCDSTGVDPVIATATSAVREARNGPAFLRQVREEIGLSLEVLSGEREAYFDTVGALNEVAFDDGLVIDIGGGSAQIAETRDREFHRAVSLTLGALALTDSFVSTDPISDDEYAAVQAEIDRQLDAVEWLAASDLPAVGLGGTIRNLAKIDAKRINYPLETLHGYRLTRRSVAESIEQFRSLPLAERRGIAGLNSDRADIILPGAMVLAAVMDRLGKGAITISVNGLREGLFFEWFWDHLPTPIIPDVRRFGVLNMARIYRYQKGHAGHVRHLAGRMFEQLAPLHGYGREERELLEAAALLHDLGTVISYDDHHKHSLALIVGNGLPGFTPREQALIALLSRYHRKGTPTPDGFEPLLADGDVTRLIRLSAILRMAEYLERGRNGAVEDVTANWRDDVLRLTLFADAYPSVELWQAYRNAVPLVEEAFGREVRIESVAAPHGPADRYVPPPV